MNHISRRKPMMVKHIISTVAAEYSSQTTIRGISYSTAKDKTFVERLWWLIVFLLSVVMCSYFFTVTLIKWQENPVKVSFSQIQTAVSEVPFPAITICPLNKIKQTVYNYTEALLNAETLTGEKLKQFQDFFLICNNARIFNTDDKRNTVNMTEEETIFKNILQFAPQLDETFTQIRWSSRFGVNRTILVPRITEEGLCFTSNSLGQDDMFKDIVRKDFTIVSHNEINEGWSMEGGYDPHINIETYPTRTSQDGSASGLNLRLRSYTNEREYKCGPPVSGFKVTLHNPADMPRVSEQYILVPVKQQMALSVTPYVMTTSPGLKNIDPHIRNCYFSHEKSLKYYKIYTQKNCQLECLANATKEICNCLPYHFPRDNETILCGYHHSCSYVMKRAELWLKAKTSIDEGYDVYKECDCLPSCAVLEYSAEASITDMHLVESALGYSPGVGNDMENWLEITELNIFFKDTHFLSLQRSELYGQIDFIANCGGLFGLFLGFSFISLFEILYFLTIRIWCTVKNRNKVIAFKA